MKIEVVKNKDKKAGANAQYLRITLDDETLLFTRHELRVARARARKNPEDCFEVEDAIKNDFFNTLFGG
jgi:hypothetical protein